MTFSVTILFGDFRGQRVKVEVGKKSRHYIKRAYTLHIDQTTITGTSEDFMHPHRSISGQV